MRIDPECLRDVLICVEENTGLRKACAFIDQGVSGRVDAALGSRYEPAEYQKTLLEKHTNDKIIYHLRYCIQDELIVELNGSTSYRMLIADLTPKGHQFIAQIRDEKQWGAVKKGLAAVRNYSLAAIGAVAEGVTSASISAYFSGEKNH